ncbi:hypothetical protein Poli38472_004005 [Pythium oligandrum]|uniref:GPI inositol-deacylase n=1 Tax=Pythium oligandrum TaxID=41045 RepID=A0A8K1FJN2_PYTOL|nr:hypothetical protein Poli38472_004005 [Pythium oligandrum]|eukprot:TMW66240.1 hypothetical protein Poli38472_004005 [Pythium oligandrum]
MPMTRTWLLPLLAALSLVLSAVYVADLLKTSAHASGCEMTYSWPVYTPVATKALRHHKFALYTIHIQRRREALTGVPVLFLPGHMGSYKQGRSITKHLTDLDAELFDVFAIDFQEQLTALNGRFVEDQAVYVNDAIRAILKMYQKQKNTGGKKRRVPESVIVVAHSMGGVVARLAETLPNHKRQSIQHVVSLGTPYDKPPLPFDADAQSVYSRIHAKIAKAAGSSSSSVASRAALTTGSSSPSSTVYVSISGGHKDTTVHSSLSITARIAEEEYGLALLSSTMPKVGVTMDHLCLLWCHQLLRSVAHSLVAVVDKDKRELIKSPSRRLELAQLHLLGVKNEDLNQTATLIQYHHDGLVDGYHSVDEFASYKTYMPRYFVRLVRARFTTLFWVMYLLVLHIFHLQVTRWQQRFDLLAQSKATPGVSQEAFPSFTSMLHPVEHAPKFIKSLGAEIARVLETQPAGRRKTIVAGLFTGLVILLGIVTELSRRYTNVFVLTTEILQLTVFYVNALGLLYVFAMLLSLVRMLLHPLVRVAVSIVRRMRLHRWIVIAIVYVLVVLIGHVRDFDLLPLDSTPRHLALLVLGSAVIFMLHLLELGVKQVEVSTDQQRYRSTLFAFYLVSCISWIGPIAYFVDVVRDPPPQVSNDLLVNVASSVSILALFRYVITRTESEMIPLPPTAFFDAEESDVYGAEEGVKTTAENCPRCIYEDGGPGAVFIEYESRANTRRIKTKQNEIVVVGPTFRVVSCDCVFRFKQPREFCGFCLRSCRLCGGGSGNFQEAQRYQEYLDRNKMDVAMHSVLASSLEWTVLVLLFLQNEHYLYYVTPSVSLLLAVYHSWMRHPIEAKRIKKEQRKKQNKLDAAAKKKKRASYKKKKSSQRENPQPKRESLQPKRDSLQPKRSTTTTKTTKQKSFMDDYAATAGPTQGIAGLE